MGKAPVGVAHAAQALGIPVYAVCGRVTLTVEEAAKAGFAGIRALTDLEPGLERSMARAGELLEAVAQTLVAELAAASAGAPTSSRLR